MQPHIKAILLHVLRCGILLFGALCIGVPVLRISDALTPAARLLLFFTFFSQ